MPEVSIIVPCLNERKTIEGLLEAVCQQQFPREEMEVIIADGMSTDGTRNVIDDFKKNHPDMMIKVVDNVHKSIPAGLNCALEAASGSYIIRLDAHSIPIKEYVAYSLQALKDGLGDIVGGIWEIQPGGDDWIAKSIAAAAAHPLGVGDARYRVGGKAQAVDTVPFGGYHRRIIDQIGFYDETLLSNEDYEFNVRVRQAGGVIWMNPDISSVYFARPTLRTLARQYWRYGYWKFRMLTRYPGTFRWRQLAGGFVLTWPVLIIASLLIPKVGWLLLIEAVVYGGALFTAGIQISRRKRELSYLVGVPLAIITMHFSWGLAFFWSGLTYFLAKIKRLFLRSGD